MRYLLLILLISSCSAEWHIKQACKKNPSICKLDTITLSDTIKVRDSFYVEKSVITREIDTIVIDTNGVKVKIIRVKDLIKTIISQSPKTIIKTRTITPKPHIIYIEKKLNKWLIFVLLSLVMGILISKIFKSN
jgi:hypothetical protein